MVLSRVINLNITCVKGNNPRSVSFDIQTTQRSAGIFIHTGTGGSPRTEFTIGIGINQNHGPTAGVIGVIGWGADYCPNSPFISDGNWHSVLISYDGMTIRIWIDGVLKNVGTRNTYDVTGNPSIFYNTVGDNNYLGMSDPNFYFNGNLKNIVLFDNNVTMSAPTVKPTLGPTSAPSTVAPSHGPTSSPSTAPSTVIPFCSSFHYSTYNFKPCRWCYGIRQSFENDIIID